jgi:hypothetical protein
MNKKKILPIWIALFFLAATLVCSNSPAIFIYKNKETSEQMNSTNIKPQSTSGNVFILCEIEGTLRGRYSGLSLGIFNFESVEVSNSEGTYKGDNVKLLVFGLSDVTYVKSNGDFSASAVFVIIIGGNSDDPRNNRPGVPTISGPHSLEWDKAGYFNFRAVDADGDKITYVINWGEYPLFMQMFDERGPYTSGVTKTFGHAYTPSPDSESPQLTFYIKVKAMDEHGAESAWSPSHTVHMPLPPSNKNK